MWGVLVTCLLAVSLSIPASADDIQKLERQKQLRSFKQMEQMPRQKIRRSPQNIPASIHRKKLIKVSPALRAKLWMPRQYSDAMKKQYGKLMRDLELALEYSLRRDGVVENRAGVCSQLSQSHYLFNVLSANGVRNLRHYVATGCQDENLQTGLGLEFAQAFRLEFDGKLAVLESANLIAEMLLIERSFAEMIGKGQACLAHVPQGATGKSGMMQQLQGCSGSAPGGGGAAAGAMGSLGLPTKRGRPSTRCNNPLGFFQALRGESTGGGGMDPHAMTSVTTRRSSTGFGSMSSGGSPAGHPSGRAPICDRISGLFGEGSAEQSKDYFDPDDEGPKCESGCGGEDKKKSDTASKKKEQNPATTPPKSGQVNFKGETKRGTVKAIGVCRGSGCEMATFRRVGFADGSSGWVKDGPDQEVPAGADGARVIEGVAATDIEGNCCDLTLPSAGPVDLPFKEATAKEISDFVNDKSTYFDPSQVEDRARGGGTNDGGPNGSSMCNDLGAAADYAAACPDNVPISVRMMMDDVRRRATQGGLKYPVGDEECLSAGLTGEFCEALGGLAAGIDECAMMDLPPGEPCPSGPPGGASDPAGVKPHNDLFWKDPVPFKR